MPGEQPNIRETLFGDMPISAWVVPDQSNRGEPWSSFSRARDLLESGREQQAVEQLQEITQMDGVESRQVLQAWHFLRQLGVTPPQNVAKLVYGVVVEVGMEEGLDIVAAYADHSARYINYSGAAIIWEHPEKLPGWSDRCAAWRWSEHHSPDRPVGWSPAGGAGKRRGEDQHVDTERAAFRPSAVRGVGGRRDGWSDPRGSAGSDASADREKQVGLGLTPTATDEPRSRQRRADNQGVPGPAVRESESRSPAGNANYCAAHRSIQALPSIEDQVIKPENPESKGRRELILPRQAVPFVWAIIVLVIMVLLPWAVARIGPRFGWSQQTPAWWNRIGLVAVAIGLGFYAWCLVFHYRSYRSCSPRQLFSATSGNRRAI